MNLPITLRSSRLRYTVLLIGALVFVASGIWFRHDNPFIAYGGVIFFGLGAIVFALQLLPSSSYLQITRDGFTMRALFRSRFIRWADVGEIGVTRLAHKKTVGWDPVQTPSRLGAANKALFGYASALPDTYGCSAEDLAETMKSARMQATLH